MFLVYLAIYFIILSRVFDYRLFKGLDRFGRYDIFIWCFKCEYEKTIFSYNRVFCNGCLIYV